MPTPPDAAASTQAVAAYDALGDKREQMAYLQARKVTADEKELRRIAEQQPVLENDVFGLDVNYRVLAADGAPNFRYLSGAERRALQDASAQVRRDAVYVSHLRATIDDHAADHPHRLREYVTERSNTLQQALLGRVAPGSSTAGDSASRDDAPLMADISQAIRAPARAGGRGGLVDKTLSVGEKLFDAQPGKRQGKPIVPPA